MKHLFRALCLLVFLTGIITFSWGWGIRQNDIEPARSFVAVYYESRTTPDGKMAISNWRTTYVKANGESKTIFHGADASAAFAGDVTGLPGTSAPVYAKTSEGTFTKDTGASARQLLTPAAPSNKVDKIDQLYRSYNFLKNSKRLDRMDKVAGFDVYVLKTVNEETPNYWIELSVSPVTGKMPLRIVTHDPDGSLSTIEAVKVEFKDVPDNLNEDIEALPKIEKSGKTETPKNQKQ